jgi:hypothetical protein
MIGGRREYVLELDGGFLPAADCRERSSEHYAGREIGGMAIQEPTTTRDGVVVTAHAAVFIRELRDDEWRGIELQAPFELLESLAHAEEDYTV